ncbi:MAG: hypothetical protein O7F71_09840 [Gammaproteobacteria bacterium]|nr:hypothetical protein [Gammaproteobacteria bacterium]
MTIPTVIATLLGLLIGVAGIMVIARPSRVGDVAERMLTTSAIKAGAILGRIAIGILLLLAAPDTRLPTFMTILGFLSIIGGVALAVMKEAWVNTLVGWWANQSETILRVWGVLITLFGGVIVYAAL